MDETQHFQIFADSTEGHKNVLSCLLFDPIQCTFSWQVTLTDVSEALTDVWHVTSSPVQPGHNQKRFFRLGANLKSFVAWKIFSFDCWSCCNLLEEKINDVINNSNTIISLCFIHKQILPPRTFPWTVQEVIFIVVIISLLLLHYPIITKRTNICVTLNPHHQDRSNLSKLLSFVNFFVAPWLRLNIS